jgi:hypothetical protein
MKTGAVVAQNEIPYDGLADFRDLCVVVFLKEKSLGSEIFNRLVAHESRVGPLPPDSETLRGIAGAEPDVWEFFEPHIMKYFKRDFAGRLYCPEVEIMRSRAPDLKGVEK